MHLPGAKVQRGHVLHATETPTQQVWHFATILPRSLNCFFTLSRHFFPRFADIGGAS